VSEEGGNECPAGSAPHAAWLYDITDEAHPRQISRDANDPALTRLDVPDGFDGTFHTVSNGLTGEAYSGVYPASLTPTDNPANPNGFCNQGARFGAHASSELFYPPYYGRLAIISWFVGGPNVISLVLLAGRVDAPALDFLLQKHFPPIFAAAAADDQYSAHAPEEMQWLSNISGNPRNKFVAFKDGRHGTEIFVPHPELPRQIVAWFVETLIKSPADPKAPVTTQKTPASEFLALADSATTVSKAVLYFHNARAHNPQAFLIPEFVMNGIGYGYIQAGQNDAAITILKLNTEAFPTSANTFDSLADAYLAAGQKEEALAAEQRCLELLPIDKIGDDFKAALRQAAEEKLKKLKANASN
jgi:hypothetical protein